jgi:Rrf2 family iron-sulfur cluster assembly transcriptional regulator
MKISRKARFAVSAMIRLGLRENRGTKTLADLSSDQGISLSYLEQLFAQLRRHGVVTGIRGPGGGYRLARPAEQISVAEIITAVDDQAYRPYTGEFDDARGDTDRMWDQFSTQLYKYLQGVSLADVLHRSATDQRKVA